MSTVRDPSVKQEKCEEETLNEQLIRCKTTNAVYATLNTKLRSYQNHAVGDIRLYTNLTEASRYIQGMCEKSRQGQDLLRQSGVLNSLIEAYLFFYTKHLENHVDPLNHDSLLKCWSNMSTALWEAVDNPVNKASQDIVIRRLIEKQDFKLIEFVQISSKSIEIQTERYVISLVQLFKALIAENSRGKKLLLAKDYFIPSLCEGLRSRLQQPKHEMLMWKSIDLIGWLLSLLLQQDLDLEGEENLENLGSQSSGSSSSNFERVLTDLVNPSLSFLDRERIAENPQSVGIIMMLASMLGRSLDIVGRFIRAKGEIIFGQIFASQQSDSVINATKMAFQVLAVQKKRIRESDFNSEIVVIDDCDAISMSSKPYSICIVKSELQPSGSCSSRRPKMPVQIVPNNKPMRLENARQWVENCCGRIENHPDRFSKSSGDSSPLPPPPPPSESSTSISHYKAPSVFSFCAPPKYQTDCYCSKNCKASSGIPTSTTPALHNHQTNEVKIKAASLPPTIPVHLNEFRFVPPMKRKREFDEDYQRNESDEEDRGSFISVKIPRMRSKKRPSEYNQQESLVEQKDIQSQLSRIIADLQPCEFMETDEHVVVLCSPAKQKTEKVEVSKYKQGMNQSKSRPTKPLVKQKSQEGIIARFFRWLFQ